MSYQIKNGSTAYPLVFMMVDSADHVTGKTGLSPTVTLSKAGAAFASPSGAVTEIGSGWYRVAGNATDSNTNGPLILHATATGADPTDALYEVVAYDPQDTVRLGLTAMPNAASGSAGAIITSGTGTAQLKVTSGIVDLPAITPGWLTASGIAASALNGKGDWNVGKTGYSLTQAFPTNFASHVDHRWRRYHDRNEQRQNRLFAHSVFPGKLCQYVYQWFWAGGYYPGGGRQGLGNHNAHSDGRHKYSTGQGHGRYRL